MYFPALALAPSTEFGTNVLPMPALAFTLKQRQRTLSSRVVYVPQH